ncbi:hypothetical protein OSB04_017165 [Centaurea solstitialis]|uniref:Uncharacterized protein n=1 Tax=Centaurea solstitialis TaxID=347529 RepID=A0AA38TEA6_9ASTR|nr:hypothetical protein OSB04_017165 [Centaurea solstitialis]
MFTDERYSKSSIAQGLSGLFPLSGKLPNALPADPLKVQEYHDAGKLRYQHLLLMMDQDPEGAHLKGQKYLRNPTASDIQGIYTLHEEKHGLPDILGSIDCMHWYWKNCPLVWRGQFHKGDHSGTSIIVEAVASHDQWILTRILRGSECHEGHNRCKSITDFQRYIRR